MKDISFNSPKSPTYYRRHELNVLKISYDPEKSQLARARVDGHISIFGSVSTQENLQVLTLEKRGQEGV